MSLVKFLVGYIHAEVVVVGFFFSKIMWASTECLDTLLARTLLITTPLHVSTTVNGEKDPLLNLEVYSSYGTFTSK